MNSFTEAAVTVASLVVGIAALSVLVSTKSNTTGVIQATASGFSNALGTAMSPVTGATATLNLGYPAAVSSNYGAPNTNLGSPTLG